MPSVPRYDSPQVTPSPLGGGRRSTVAGGVDPAAREQSQLGNALLRTGEAFSNIMRDMQERENADVVFRAETKVKDDYLAYEQEAREKRQGRYAKDLTTDTNKWWEDQLKSTTEGMTNGMQRKIFTERVTRLREQSMGAMSHYESVQLERSHDEGWQASKNSTISVAAASPTNEAIDSARLELQRANRYQAARRGWEPDRLKAETLKDTTTLHKNVIENLALRDPMAAKAYFEKHKGEIDGTQHAELGKFAKQSTDTAMGDAAAEEAWQAHGPKSDRDAVSLDVLETKVREKLKANPDAMKHAVAGVKERASAFKDGRKERDEAIEGAVWRQHNGGATIAQIRRQPEFLQLSSEKQSRIVEHIESQTHTRAAREMAEREREGFAAYSIYSRPENLEAMTENQILALTPSLGNRLVAHLIENKRHLGTKIMQANMDQQDFDHVANEAGLRPFETKKSESDKARLGELKFRIEQMVDAEQQRLKRPLQREEKMELFRKEMHNAVIVDYMWPWPDATKPVMLLNPNELKDAYVMVDGTKVQLASIPALERAAIIRERQRRNLPLSEEAIARTWLASRPKKQTNSPALKPATQTYSGPPRG
jgi:hypothetical protein